MVGAGAVGFLVWRARANTAEHAVSAERAGAAAPGGGRPGGADARPTTVLTAFVTKKDVPIYLDGLGTVTAYKTVTVRPRVDGQLQTVAFKEGQALKAGAVIAQVDPRPFQIQLHQAEAALARDGAQLKGAKLNLDRYTAVRKDKLIAEQQVDDQRTVVEGLEAAVRSDEAQVENAKLTLDWARITSPIDGVTGVRLVDPGNMVKASDPNGIVIVTQLDPIAVLFTLPQDVLQSVAFEMGKAQLTVTAFSRDGQAELGKGQVELIDNQINTATSTIRLKAIFPNPGHSLWPNQFVKARLLLTTRQGALVVPAVAIQRGPRGTFVYVVGKDNKANLRNVEVDQIEGELAMLKSGLEAGDQVVVDGQSQLRPGASVQVKAPEGEGKGKGEGRTKQLRPGGPTANRAGEPGAQTDGANRP